MISKVLRGYPLESKNGQPDPTFVGVNMPVGGETAGAMLTPDGGIVVFTIGHPTAPRVWYPIRIFPLDEPQDVPLGRTMGKVIAMLMMNGAPHALVVDGPWPTSTLQGVEAQGNG